MSFFNLYLHLCTAVLYLGRFSHCLTGTFLETGAPCRAPGAGAGSACAPVYPPIAMRVVFSFRRCKRVPGTRQPCRGPRPAARHAFPSFERPERSPELPAGSPRSPGFSLSHFGDGEGTRRPVCSRRKGFTVNFDVFRRLFIYLFVCLSVWIFA